MKLTVGILIITILPSCFGKQPEKSGLEGKLMPTFNILLTDSSTYFNTSSIRTGEPVVLFYFDPKCPFSRAQMHNIIQNIKALKNIQFYMLTTAPFNEMKIFYEDFELKTYQNITIGIDYAYFFRNYFRTHSVPYIAIYNKNKRLIKSFEGKTNSKQIKQVAET